jgi:TolA-binding protein
MSEINLSHSSNNLNDCTQTQHDTLFKNALKLYKEKQYEEAAFHFVDCAKQGGLGGGEAEYYAGHIYFDKLDNLKEAKKYLMIAHEKKHILPAKYLQIVASASLDNQSQG